MSGKSSVWIASIVAIAVVVLSVGGALAAQDSRPAALAHLAQQAATPQPNADPQRVIDALAAYFGVPADEIQALFDSGAGLGVIAEAYALADVTGMTPQEIVAAKVAGELNWGQFLKDAGVDPAQVKVKLGDIVSGTNRGGQQADADAADGQGEQQQDQDQTQQQDRNQERSAEKAQTEQQSQNQERSSSGSANQNSNSDHGNGGSDGGNGNGGGGKNK